MGKIRGMGRMERGHLSGGGEAEKGCTMQKRTSVLGVLKDPTSGKKTLKKKKNKGQLSGPPTKSVLTAKEARPSKKGTQ